jgi:hypothetical protein
MKYPPLIFKKPADNLVKNEKDKLFQIYRNRTNKLTKRQNSTDALKQKMNNTTEIKDPRSQRITIERDRASTSFGFTPIKKAPIRQILRQIKERPPEKTLGGALPITNLQKLERTKVGSNRY